MAPTGSQVSPAGATERPPANVCIFLDIELFFILKKCRLLYKKAMAAANFSRDVLEMFYGTIEENRN